MALLSAAQAGAQQFPDGPGKDILETKCGTCHAPTQVMSGGGRSPEEWTDVGTQMIDMGAEVPADQVPTVVAYLVKNGQLKRTGAPAAIASASGGSSVSTGNTPVTFKEWAVPTPDSRPHDPLAASDGSIWYTGMNANVLGRFDPKTQQFKEFKLKTPASGPHGLTEDAAGHIWFTANTKGYIG